VTTNWGRNYTYRANVVHRPSSPDELSEIVVRAERVRVLGTKHSFFSDIADAPELITLDGLLGETTVEGGDRHRAGGPDLFAVGRQAARRGSGSAQPRVASAHLGRRRDRNSHTRVRQPERKPRDPAHSAFHLVERTFPNGAFGNYPEPVRVENGYVACDAAGKTFLISYGDVIGLSANLACLKPSP